MPAALKPTLTARHPLIGENYPILIPTNETGQNVNYLILLPFTRETGDPRNDRGLLSLSWIASVVKSEWYDN
jgi:hypothetical protein